MFGYGSLVHREALESFLGHELDGDLFGVGSLRGYRRAWNVARDNRRSGHSESYRHRDGRRHEGTVTVLGIEAAGEAWINGVFIGVTQEDLLKLDRREAMYERVEVTAAVDGAPGPGRIITYLPSPAFRRLHSDGVAAGVDAISRHYLDTVTTGFGRLGELDRYERTTSAPVSPVLDIAKPSNRPPNWGPEV